MSQATLEHLLSRARLCSFVPLVHALEASLPARAKVGALGPFEQETLRFRHDPALVFHSSDVADAQRIDAGGVSHVEVTTTFLGLSGSASPMPSYFVDQILGAEDQAAVQREFLDLFHHRLLGLCYRALLKFDAPRSFDAGADAISRYVLTLCGLSPEHAERVTGLPLATLLRLAPLMATYAPGSARLCVALRDFLQELPADATVEVVPLAGGSVELETSERPLLGRDLRLGVNSLLGSRARAPASAICVRIGPLSSERCAELSPGGRRFDQLRALTTLFTPAAIAVQFELMPVRGAQARLGHGHQLSRNAWLGSLGRPAPVRFQVAQSRCSDREG